VTWLQEEDFSKLATKCEPFQMRLLRKCVRCSIRWEVWYVLGNKITVADIDQDFEVVRAPSDSSTD
jgi:hypothetical protein